MMRTAAALLLLCFAVPAFAGNQELLIVHATLISGRGTEPVADAWIRVSDGRIAEVGSGSPDTGDERIVDAGGRYLIPGLIDSHVHLYHATGLKRKYTRDFERLYRDYMIQQPRSFLYYGFTTVVELNAEAEANARFVSAPEHPHLVHCGQGIVLQNGFMSLDFPPGEFEDAYPGFLIDHYRAAGTDDEAAARHSPEAAVAHVLAAGGRCVKIYYEEALWWPGPRPDFQLPSVAIMRDVVRIAHEHNLPVLLHATTPAGHQFGLQVGVDILAHGMWEWPGQPFDAPEPTEEYRRIAKDVARSGIRIQPTLTTVRNAASLFDPTVLDDPGWRHAVPASYLLYLRTDAQAQRDDFLRMFAQSLPAGATTESLPALQHAFQTRYLRLIERMREDGTQLIFGTDTAVGGFGWAAPPGLAGYREIRAWADAGIPLPEIFRALTVENAAALRIDADAGSIEPGKRADMLLLRKNPLECAEAYDSIDAVIVGGKWLERDALSAN